jgi:ribosomal protein S18 acetylase RimI-like enzyme
MKIRRPPISVLIVAILYLAVGIIGFAYHFPELRAGHPDAIWIELTEFLAIVAGVFMLRGQNWARWLALAWIAFHVALSIGSARQFMVHSLICLAIAWALFHPRASRFFHRAETEIRQAHAKDAEGISACLAAAFEPFRAQYTADAFLDTVPPLDVIRERIAQMKVYVAVPNDGKIVGTLAASAANGEGHLRGMAVQSDWQGQGIAGRLLAQAENDLRAAGCSRVTLDTTLPLQRAIRFYEKNGFAPSGKITDFYGMPLHEYAKQLT